MSRFKKGQRVKWKGDEYDVLVPEPDSTGDIVAECLNGGQYIFLAEAGCEPVPEYRWFALMLRDQYGNKTLKECLRKYGDSTHIARVNINDPDDVTIERVQS